MALKYGSQPKQWLAIRTGWGKISGNATRQSLESNYSAIRGRGCEICRFPASLPVTRYPLPRLVVRIVRRAVELFLPGGRGSCRAKAKLGRSLALPLESWQFDFNLPFALEAFRLWK